MGSAYSIRTRAPGSGSVTRVNGRYWARMPPKPGQRYGDIIGKFDTAWHAHRAADKWCAERKAS